MTTITPSGIRCTGASKEKLEREVKKSQRMGVELSDKEMKCTDFFECFDCPSHALVASEVDIWLMLSFQSQILEMKDLGSVNSKPTKKLYEKEALISKTIERMRDKSPEQYSKAMQRFENDGYHPLYESRHSLKDLLEKFNA